MNKFVIFILVFLLINSRIFCQNQIEQIGTWTVNDIQEFKCSNLNSRGSDINNDGFDDFIFLANEYPNDEWKYKFFMGSNTLSTTFDFEFEIPFGAGFPSWAGDLNGDGYNDIVFSEASYISDPGSVMVCFGNEQLDLNVDFTINGEDYVPDPWGLFIQGCNGGYDFNNDGYNDLLVWSEGPDFWWTGLALIFLGGEELSTIPDFQMQGNSGEQIAYFRAVGDINGDGYDDLLINRFPEYPFAQYGNIEVYFGGEEIDTICDFVFNDVYFNPNYYSMPSADLNGDDCDDFIIGNNIYFGNPDLNNVEILATSYWLDFSSINDDSFSDLICWDTEEDTLHIIYGEENFELEPDISISVEHVNYYDDKVFFYCNIGDVNGDGEDELLLNNAEDGFLTNTALIKGLYTPNYIENYIINNNSFNLSNYPNPFNPSTTIEFSIQNESNIQITIFNIKGQKIKTLFNNNCSNGNHTIIWNGVDESNNPVSSGIYYYKLKVNGKTEVVKKCMLLK